MAIQFYMRGYDTATSQYVDWVVNDEPDTAGIYSGVNPLNFSNIAINRVVTSKINNFLKPSFPNYLNINTFDGPYLLHLNSYDWLHPNTSSFDPPIPAPSNLVGLAINRGTIDSNFPNPTPRPYSTLTWNETSSSWAFGYLDPVSGGISSYTPFATGDTTIYGHLTIDDGGNPAQSGTIRIPNAKEIVARNFTNSGDCTVISLDISDRVTIGSVAVPTFFPNYQINDSFIAESTSPGGDLTDTATAGFIRLKHNTNGISFYSKLSLPGNNASIISTDINDTLYIGDSNNNSIVYSTKSAGSHIFAIATNFIATVSNSGFYFADTLFSPTIGQFFKSSGDGQNLLISAQATTDVLGYGGSITLKSGDGSAGDGYVDFKTGNTTRFRVYGSTTPIVTDYTENSSFNTDSLVIYNNKLRFYNTLPIANIIFDPINLAAVTAATFNVQGQSNLGAGGRGGDVNILAGFGFGASSNGGDLYLSSGAGSTSNGVVTIQSGVNNRAIFSDTSQIFNVDTLGYYQFNVASLPVVTIIDDKLVTAKGRRRSVKSISSTPYTILNEDDVLAVDVSASAITIYLPVGSIGDTYDIKDATGQSNINNIIIDASTNGSTIDGNNFITLNLPYASATLIFNGVEWNII